ncbi:uncharacterized protein [Littorina saxatilis]|uniref:uncharacterized protein n=1 Tax=Littorina saxatilis TaxID=31220 RepID=UPI0038B42B2C
MDLEEARHLRRTKPNFLGVNSARRSPTSAHGHSLLDNSNGNSEEDGRLLDNPDERNDELGENVDDGIVDNFAKIPFEDLSDEDLEVLLLLDDAKFLRQADEHIVIKLLQEQHQALYASGQHGLRRKKRFLGLGLLFGVLGKLVLGAKAAVVYTAANIPSIATTYALSTVAENFFSGMVRSDTTRSEQHITQLYIRTGNYTVALQDFQNFRLDNVRSISNGETGTMEDLRFTVQNGNPPTLKVRSHDGTLVREVRYEEAESEEAESEEAA